MIILEKIKNGISVDLGALPPGGRYFFVLGAQYNHNFYQGLYENKPFSLKKEPGHSLLTRHLKLINVL